MRSNSCCPGQTGKTLAAGHCHEGHAGVRIKHNCFTPLLFSMYKLSLDLLCSNQSEFFNKTHLSESGTSCLLPLMMSSQTGVNPEHLQAVRKARKKQMAKANGNHYFPLKVYAKVSPPLLSCLLCIYMSALS